MKKNMKSLTCMFFAVALATSGCGESKKKMESKGDLGPSDHRDAGAKQSAPLPGAENVSGAGKLQGGTVKMDIQIGHPLSQELTLSRFN